MTTVVAATSRVSARSAGHGQCRRAIAGVVLLLLVTMSLMNGANAQDINSVPNEGNPCSIGWYRAHGWLMWLAFGIFLPLGVLASRYGQHYSQWLGTHLSLGVMGVILATIAFGIAAKKFQVTTWDNTHVKLGIAIMILVWLQPMAALIRPRRGTVVRRAWFAVHWLFGTAAIILGWFNIFKGLDVYVGNWPSGGERKAAHVLWGVNVAILAFLYLLLERLPYIRFQAKDPDVVRSATSSDEPTYYKNKKDGPTVSTPRPQTV